MGLLDVHNLSVDLPTAAGWIRPVNEVSFRLAPAQSLGLVGESGSGKTMLALALMGLLPPGARVAGTAMLRRAGTNESNLTHLNEKAWRAVRGCEIAMVFQEPMTSLNPVMRIGAQIEEAIQAHDTGLPSSQLRSRVLEALRHASVPEPKTRVETRGESWKKGPWQRCCARRGTLTHRGCWRFAVAGKTQIDPNSGGGAAIDLATPGLRFRASLRVARRPEYAAAVPELRSASASHSARCVLV